MILRYLMNRVLLFFFGLLILLSSCVTNKKFVLVQKDDVNPSTNQLKKDTVVREYQVKSYDYKIQANDILSVRFESLTTEEFDFLSKDQDNGSNNIMQSNALMIGELVD